MITFKQLGKYGRLGNQLWEIAATIALAKLHSQQYMFPMWAESKNFNIPEDKFINNLPNMPEYHEFRFAYDFIPFSGGNLNLHGYFQSFKYFEDIEGEIINLLTPKDASKYDYKNTASIHVRRGDYVKLKGYYKNLDMKYYEKAMELSKENRFIIFSDDIPWCKKHFIGNHFEFSEGSQPHTDMAMMSKCSSNIGSNSSFAWWGAFLNRNDSKIVITPREWFGPNLSNTHNAQDIIPNKWIQI